MTKKSWDLNLTKFKKNIVAQQQKYFMEKVNIGFGVNEKERIMLLEYIDSCPKGTTNTAF